MPSRLPAVGRTLRFISLALLGTLLVAAVDSRLAPPAHAEGTIDRRAVHRFVADYVDRHGLPGAAVAVVRHGAVIDETGVGEDGAITARTPIGVGSVSKLITAFVVLQLVDDGRIGLDDTVSERLPEFSLDDPRGSKITIRQLLSHTSGLPNPVLVPPADTLRQGVAQLQDTDLVSDPGTSYLYSNLNYHVAARLIEKISGEPFADYLRRRVFEPLGMHDTRSVVVASAQPGLDDGHVTAYGGAIRLPVMRAMIGGAGGVISTAHDLGLWLAMLQNGGVTADGTRLLSERLIKESLTAQPAADSTGLGWQHTRTADPARIGKDGTLTRYSARVDLVPGSGYAVAVLMNSYTPTFKHPYEISTGVIDIAEGRPAAPAAPVPTIIDGVLGLITLGWIALTVRGVLRVGRWSRQRRRWPGWRLVLRLLPQLIMPAAAVIVFLVLPQVQNNTATPLDAFGLWPAAMVLSLVGGVGGLLLTVLRIRRRFQPTET